MSNLAIAATTKMSIKYIFMCIVLFYFGRSDLVSAETLESKLHEIEVQKTCLGQFADYDNWIDFLRGKKRLYKDLFPNFKV